MSTPRALAAALWPRVLWLCLGILPLYWGLSAHGLAIGRRTGDLTSHIWAIWNGTQGDPTRSMLCSYPEGADLLVIFGGWLHTFVGVAFARAGLGLEHAYNASLCLMLLGTGVGGMVLTRACGARWPAAVFAGVLLQLDGWVLYNAMDGRPEHAGFGPLLLAFAGALASWRGVGGRGVPVLTGVAGALVFVVSWEQALWLAMAMAWLSPWLWWSERPPGALRRWGIAALTAVVVASPWVGTFLMRAIASRELDEGTHAMAMARDQSTSLGVWLLGTGGQPTRVALLCLLLSPWLVPARYRRLLLGVIVGLVASMVLALGPDPGWWHPGDLDAPIAPYISMQSLPLVGWFHSPARLAMGFSFASIVAAGLLVDRLGRGGWLRRVAAALLALGLLGAAVQESVQARDWPMGGFKVPDFPAVARLAELPGEGAVLDLPPGTDAILAQEVQLMQLLHHRPVAGHAWLPHLAPDSTPQHLQTVPWLAWISGLIPGEAPELTDAQRDYLSGQGFRFLAIHLGRIPSQRRGTVNKELWDTLGPPVTQRAKAWAAWDLEAAP